VSHAPADRPDTQPLMVVKCGMQNRRTDPPCISRSCTLPVATCTVRRRVPRSARVHARRRLSLSSVALLEVSPSCFLSIPLAPFPSPPSPPPRARRPRRTAVQVRAALCAGRVAAHRPRRRKRRLASAPAVIDVLPPPPPHARHACPNPALRGVGLRCAASHRARSPHSRRVRAACSLRCACLTRRRPLLLYPAHSSCAAPARAGARCAQPCASPRLLPGVWHTNARAGACAARRLAPPRGVD
jgi:hypothetical protein